MSQGDPVEALALLTPLTEDPKVGPYAQELCVAARGEIDAMVDQWLRDVDGRIADGLVRSAEARLAYMRDHWPLTAAQRVELKQRWDQAATLMPQVRDKLQADLEAAQDAMLQNKFDDAARTLREARSMAWDLNEEQALSLERMLASAVHRKNRLEAQNPSKKDRRRVRRVRRRGGRDREAAPATSPAPAVSSTPDEVQALLKEAARQRQRQAHFESIVAYRQVLAKDANNIEAKGALRALEAKRVALVRSYLQKANRFFLRQDLAAAAPYYERVLMLDPTNEKAREGVRMHENLRRIQREASGEL